MANDEGETIKPESRKPLLPSADGEADLFVFPLTLQLN